MPPVTITLREITGDNAEAVLAVRLVPGGVGPAGFYARLGFVPTGELDPDGEIILRRPIPQ